VEFLCSELVNVSCCEYLEKSGQAIAPFRMHQDTTDLSPERTAWSRAVNPLRSLSKKIAWRISGKQKFWLLVILSRSTTWSRSFSFPHLHVYQKGWENTSERNYCIIQHA
jgi:hypothetical protein